MTEYERMDEQTEEALFKLSTETIKFILERLPKKSVEKYSQTNLLLNNLTGCISMVSYAVFPKDYLEAFLNQLVLQIRTNYEFQEENKL